MDEYYKILEYGVLGLAAICTVLAFRLLSAQLEKTKSQRTTLPIFVFMGVTALLAVISGVFRLLEADRADGANHTQEWTVFGAVQRNDVSDHGGIKVEVMPPNPNTISHESGTYEIRGLRLEPGDKPGLFVEAPGYFPETRLGDELEKIATIDRENRTIEIPLITLESLGN